MRRQLSALLVSLLLVSTIAVGPVAAAQINPNASAAHNPYIEADVTKAEHTVGDDDLREYEANNGQSAMLPATMNESHVNPVAFTFSDIEANAYQDFPRSNDTVDTWANARWWSESEAGTAGSGTVTNVTTAPDVEGLEVATSGQTSGDTYRATFDSVSLTSDVEKRHLQLVADVESIDSGAYAMVTLNDSDGDYVATMIDNRSGAMASWDNTTANQTGEGFVSQEQIGQLSVMGSGDGQMQEVQEVSVLVKDGNADIDIAGLNAEKLGQWDLGDRMADTDGDGDNETVQVDNVTMPGEQSRSSLDTLGPAFDSTTIHDLTVPMQFWSSMQPTGDDPPRVFVNYSEADAFANFDQRVNDYRRIILPEAYDLSYANTEFVAEVRVPSTRYQAVEYGTGISDSTNMTNASLSDATSQFGSLDSEIQLATGIGAGEGVVFHVDYVVTGEEHNALTSASTAGGGGGIFAGGSGGDGGFFGAIGTWIAGILGALGLRKVRS
ncbi:hypothetical protein ACFQL1_15020 [Halomicroarcula sp. GCM10025709]|uniref:hypothetical protein n=1 Tax=Haloarcula TaxID=2237 RepID=UPI0024C2DA4F|nr:hypothetical protein [Halomicroarcula sp. YJ-61-S]